MYIENPKMAKSGIYACIPQLGECPNNCHDCFFQNGRSYLEPLDTNLPNMPDSNFINQHGLVVRVNDGNDSNVNRRRVVGWTAIYNHRFFNTAIPKNLDSLPGPVVLTVNPGIKTDDSVYFLDPIPRNLMFVRVRVNTWNLHVLESSVDYYTELRVPVVATFLAYHSEDSIPKYHRCDYTLRKRTLNKYWAITTRAWRDIMWRHQDNTYVYSCGKIEGELGNTKCERCGNCVREYFVALDRMKRGDQHD
jgi:hypothetical protein